MLSDLLKLVVGKGGLPPLPPKWFSPFTERGQATLPDDEPKQGPELFQI